MSFGILQRVALVRFRKLCRLHLQADEAIYCPKRWIVLQPHRVISQKTSDIVTAVQTSQRTPLFRSTRIKYKTKTPWPLVRERTIPTDRPPIVDEVSTFVDRGVSRGQRGGSPTVVNLSFLDRSRYFSFK
jgi:hypothetical protein